MKASISLWTRLVEESLAVCCWANCVKHWDPPFSWPPGGTPTFTQGNKITECELDNFVPVVAMIEHRATPSRVRVSAGGNAELDEREPEETMLAQKIRRCQLQRISVLAQTLSRV